jgi:hypothetical protein
MAEAMMRLMTYCLLAMKPFIVLVLLNYSERWLAEGQRQHTQVRNVWINHCGNCLPVV